MSIQDRIEGRPCNPVSQVDPFTRAKVIAAECALRSSVARGLGDAVHIDGEDAGEKLRIAHMEAELMARFTAALSQDVVRSTSSKLTEEETRRVGKIVELSVNGAPERDAMTALWALEDSALGAAIQGDESAALDMCEAYSSAFESIGVAGRSHAERSGFEVSPPDELTAEVRARLAEARANGVQATGVVSLRRLGSAFGVTDSSIREHLAATPLRPQHEREEIAASFKRMAKERRGQRV